MLKPLKHDFFAEMWSQSPVFGGGRRRRFCELWIPLLSGKSSLIRLFTSNETSSANSTDGRSSSPHRHHVHAAWPHLPFLAQTFSSFNLIGCKMTCCGSSLSRSRFASIDMRTVHGDLARDSGLERSVGGPAERVRGRLPLLVLGRSVSSRYVCADILYDRSVGRAWKGGGVSVRG